MSHHRSFRLLHVFNSFRQYATKTKIELDPAVLPRLKKNTFSKHLGQTHPRNVVRMPQDIEEAIIKILKDDDHSVVDINKGMAFIRHLHGRHVPLEEDEKELLAKMEEFKSHQKLLKKQPDLDPKQYAKLKEREASSVLLRRKVKENLWKPVKYDDQKCAQYLLLRGPADYAVLKVIFSEIATRDPDFKPQSLLDFGSGVGTVSWVVQQLWKTCKEFYNVDICSSMRELAGLVLKRGNPQTELPPSIFFKGFLPSSLTYTHDIVVSAYSLFELPSRKQRLETLLTLWNKADSYLVIVEDGTYAGYKLVVEARDFILEMAEKDQEVSGGTGAHVFAPCAHDLACPKYLTSKYPCNFEVTYMQHPNVLSSQAVRERYSYVVLKRGPRNPEVKAWPRVVEDMKVRNKHCRVCLCTPEGELRDVVLTKAKNADGTYKVITSSMWGDLVPFHMTQYESDELSSADRYRLKLLEKEKKNQSKTEEDEDTSDNQQNNLV